MFLRSSLYFLGCTTRNRVLGMVRRLREPKYILGLVLTGAYFWFLFFANPAFGVANQEVDPERRRDRAELMIGGFYLFQVLVSWFSLGTGRGVAFREAEVQNLFPRPFTRGQVLLLKWMGALFPMVIGALIVGLLFRRFGDFHYGRVVGGFLLNQTALYANATLVGLLLAHWKSGRGLLARLTRLPAWGLLTAVILCLVLGWRSIGPGAGWEAVERLFTGEWVRGVLTPFTQLAVVMTAPDAGAFAAAALYPLALIVVHVVLIRWGDFSFEDQAVEIAQRITRVRAEGMSALRPPTTTGPARTLFPLAPVGPVWMALVWKNVTSLGRLPRRAWIRLFIILTLLGVFLTSTIDEGETTSGIGLVLLILLLYGSVLAPSLVRVDLRIDIPHFDVLKALPLSGRALILGEVLGTVLVLFVAQLILCVVAVLLISTVPSSEGTWHLSPTDRICGLVALLASCLAMNFALVTIENLVALWLPGFVRLGRGVRPGFDQVGQNLLGAMIRFLTMLLVFLAPVLVALMLAVLLGQFEVALAPTVALCTALGAALVVVESYLLIVLSEGRYDRFDLTSEKITEGE